jgi:Skp family chaperone for outer membrane proteins
MKKLSVLLVSFISLIFLSNAFAINGKIGVVDSQKISTSPKAVQLQKSLQEQFEPKWVKITEKQKTLHEMAAKMKRDNTIMRDSDKQSLQNKMTNTQKELVSMMDDFKKKFAQAQQSMTESFMADVKKAVAKVAKKNQLDFVVPKDFVLYAQNEMDITAQVEKILK